MDDSYWKLYTEKGDHFFYSGASCCAIRHYQYALEEAEFLLQNSFYLKENIPLVAILMTSYHNIIRFFSHTHRVDKLNLVCKHFINKMLFILSSKDFPLPIQEVCFREVHYVYYIMLPYSRVHKNLEVDLYSILNGIKEAKKNFLLHQSKLTTSHS